MNRLFILFFFTLVTFGCSPSNSSTSDIQKIANAYQNQISNLQVRGSGTVIHILPDDTNGSQHQKFIIKLSTGQTLLIAHNIDLAPRVYSLNKGDTVEFNGEYEWNSKGGIVHIGHIMILQDTMRVAG